MNFEDSRLRSEAVERESARTYERMANELLLLRNEAKALGNGKLRAALEQAYFEAVDAGGLPMQIPGEND